MVFQNSCSAWWYGFQTCPIGLKYLYFHLYFYFSLIFNGVIRGSFNNVTSSFIKKKIKNQCDNLDAIYLTRVSPADDVWSGSTSFFFTFLIIQLTRTQSTQVPSNHDICSFTTMHLRSPADSSNGLWGQPHHKVPRFLKTSLYFFKDLNIIYILPLKTFKTL